MLCFEVDKICWLFVLDRNFVRRCVWVIFLMFIILKYKFGVFVLNCLLAIDCINCVFVLLVC